MNKIAISVILALGSLSACQQETSVNLISEFTLEEGFQIKAVAAEPLLTSPVEIEFDEKGRIWALEMTGYMRDIDGSDEKLADGRISILEDTDGDGVMDTKKVFLDNLELPRAIELIDDGLLYAEPPNLWWVKIVNDQPMEPQLIDSTYSMGGNVEHAPNGLLYNLDNWIYSAKSDRRYRYKEGKWEREAALVKGQWGISNDDSGRLFYNNNSNPIFGDFVQANQVNANPYLHAKQLENKNLSKSRRLYAAHPTLINRGYLEGGLDSLGRVLEFTSACSPVLYRGNQFRDSFYQNAFVCGPEANLVKRYQLVTTDGKIEAKPTSENYEFLVSNDESFRPVNINNGPDGALYIVDMRRAIIQHRAYMTSYLKEHILERKMDEWAITGRIFRVNDTTKPIEALPDFSALSLKDWIPLLQSPNAWQRTTAQKKLVFANDKNLVEALTKIAIDDHYPLGQIHVLWVLEGMNSLTASILVNVPTENPQVLSQVIVLAKSILNTTNENQLLPIFEKAIASKEYDAHLQLAHSIGFVQQGKKIALTLAEKYANDPIIAQALVSSWRGQESDYLQAMNSTQEESSLAMLLAQTIENINADNQKKLTISVADKTDNRTRGFELYKTYCATCHGMDGKGLENLAPPLYMSEYADGPPEHLILIMLHGLKGPITVHGKMYEGAAVMPGIKDNPYIDDQGIYDIMAFIKSGFAKNSTFFRFDTKKIAKIRAATADRKDMFTEEELKNWTLGEE